jgi:hypothetical protein
MTPILNSSFKRLISRERVVVLPDPGDDMTLSKKVFFSFNSFLSSAALLSFEAKTDCFTSIILIVSMFKLYQFIQQVINKKQALEPADRFIDAF